MWILLEYLAWGTAAALLLWMVWDAVRVNREFDEETLLSSREGIDELLEHQQKHGTPGGRHD